MASSRKLACFLNVRVSIIDPCCKQLYKSSARSYQTDIPVIQYPIPAKSLFCKNASLFDNMLYKGLHISSKDYSKMKIGNERGDSTQVFKEKIVPASDDGEVSSKIKDSFSGNSLSIARNTSLYILNSLNVILDVKSINLESTAFSLPGNAIN